MYCRYIKLADLGSARSTLLEKHLHQPDSSQPGSQQQLHQFAAATARQQQQQWFTTQNNATQTSGDGGGSGKNSASQQQQQQHGVHSRHDSMDSTGSGGWQQQQQRVTRLRPVGAPVHHSDSFVGDSGSSPSEIYARCEEVVWVIPFAEPHRSLLHGCLTISSSTDPLILLHSDFLICLRIPDAPGRLDIHLVYIVYLINLVLCSER